MDPDARRGQVAEAVWRIIRRRGLEHASVRNVAREAGLSTGSLRHYFASQSELVSFAMSLVSERVRRRLEELSPSVDEDARRFAERALHELLPLDDERRVEAEVWLAFTARAMVDPGLRQLLADTYDALRQACHAVIRLLVDGRYASAELDVSVEAERLHALLDGLALHSLTRPELAAREHVIAVLALHLDQLGQDRFAG